MANEKRLISAEQAYEVARLHHNDFAQSIADLKSLREVLEDCDTVDAVPTMNSVPVWIVHRKDGVYDVYKENRYNWVLSRLSADNIFAWLAEQNLVDIQFVDEEI